MRPAALVGSAALGVILTSALLTPACVQHRVDPAAPAASAASMESGLRAEVSGRVPAYVGTDTESRALWQATRRLYADRGYSPAWLEGTSPTARVQALVNALRDAESDGLDPSLYNVDLLASRAAQAPRRLFGRGTLPVEMAAPLEVQLTYTYLTFASDLADGIGDLARADAAWQIRPEPFDAVAHLRAALERGAIRESLESLRPTAPQYRVLRDALARYRELARRGGWPVVARGTKAKPGETSVAVTRIARRLAASGELRAPVPEDAAAKMTYDQTLEDAVKAFQVRHGLAPDGIVGPAVVAAMNVSAEERVRQIALNMERWRWLPRSLGSRYILVNIPAFHLEVWENGAVPLAMRVVVGKKDTQTPIFDDRMTYLVFSPYWNVPPDIARDETLPSVLADAAFLERSNMEIVDTRGAVVRLEDVDLTQTTKYRFRQRPGGGNSLGLVKFMFPNQFNVYLHDTPADSLFARAVRSYSHGCVRVEQPEALAAYVLRDQSEWTADTIREAMAAGEEKTVKLSEPLPVYLGYWTASATADGELRFADDIYGVDARQTRLVTARLDGLRQRAAAAAATEAGARGMP